MLGLFKKSIRHYRVTANLDRRHKRTKRVKRVSFGFDLKSRLTPDELRNQEETTISELKTYLSKIKVYEFTVVSISYNEP